MNGSIQSSTILTPPMALPLHRQALKSHLRIGLDTTAEDDILDDYIREAVDAVESDTGRAIVCQRRRLTANRFPCRPSQAIELRGCPVMSVESMSYTNSGGDSVDIDLGDFEININSEPCRITPKNGSSWPNAGVGDEVVTVTYLAGYVIPFTASAGGDTITLQGSSPANGDRWRLTNSGGALPGGLSIATDYYVVNANGDTCKLSLTPGGSAVNITSNGTGTSFLGSVPPIAMMAIRLRAAMSWVDREGAEYDQCYRGYWSKIHSLRYGEW